MKISKLIKRCVEGHLRSQKTSNNSFFYKSQNRSLYSYGEEIAFFTDDIMFILGKTAKYDNFYSYTTSRHFGKIKSYCEENEVNYVVLCKETKYVKLLDVEFLDDTECPICYEKIDKGYSTKCNHFFCKKCLDEWCKNNYNCPYCRNTLF